MGKVNRSDLSIVILAGGESKRMGQDKGLIDYHGKPLIQHIIETTSNLSKYLYISANSTDYEAFNLPIIYDSIRGEGPIGGILASLQQVKTGAILFLTCDSPLISKGTLEEIIEQSFAQVNVARIEDRVYPLTGIYYSSSINQLQSLYKTGERSIYRMLKDMDCNYIDFPQEYKMQFKNMNTPEDLKS